MTATDNWQNVETKALTGCHFGGFISFFPGDHFALQPEWLYSFQGAKFESTGQTTNQKVSYINVPVLLKYRTTSGFYLEAGLQIGLKARQASATADSLAKSTDFSIAAGIGYRSKIGLGIGARYSAGISKVGDFNSLNGIIPDYKNGGLQLSILSNYLTKDNNHFLKKKVTNKIKTSPFKWRFKNLKCHGFNDDWYFSIVSTIPNAIIVLFHLFQFIKQYISTLFRVKIQVLKNYVCEKMTMINQLLLFTNKKRHMVSGIIGFNI